MPRHLRRRTETLIPVSLRLLDESGRHRIAEPMLGIAVEVSGYDLQVNVMGRSGRPLSFGLAKKQKVVVSFLATELHEKVESLVCDLQSVVPVSGQPDAWDVRLLLPALMPELSEEIITALQRYGRKAPRTVGAWTAGGLMAVAASLAWLMASWSAQSTANAKRWETDRLKAQLAYSAQTIDELANSLEEADRELETQRRSLADADEAQSELADLRAENDALSKKITSINRVSNARARIHLRGVSLTDFRTVRSIRGAATAPRLAYQDGTLELIESPADERRVAQTAGRMLLAYAQLRAINIRRRGSWSLESPDGTFGVETGEAFVLGEAVKDQPDFVFETRDPSVGSWLAAYAAIGIQEVWIWVGNRLEFRRLVDDSYVTAPRSGLLTELDPNVFARFVEREDPGAAAQEFAQVGFDAR